MWASITSTIKLFGPAAVLLAHSWYPIYCCSERDCKAVPCDQISRLPDKEPKYLWHGMTFTKPQPSPDGSCHVCENGYPICIFLPPES